MRRSVTMARGSLGRATAACGAGVVVVLMFLLPGMLGGAPAAFGVPASAAAQNGAQGSAQSGAQGMGNMQSTSSQSGARQRARGAGAELSLLVARSGASSDQLVLTAAVSSPVSNERVSFFVVTTELGGRRLVPLGSAAVTPSGDASLTYQPTWTGTEQFVAQIGSDPSKPAASASRTFLVTSAVPGMSPALTNSPKPLRQVGHGFVVVVLVVVALVWTTLLATLYRVVRGTRRLARVT